MAINYEAVIAQPNFFDTYQKKKDTLEALMFDWESIHGGIGRVVTQERDFLPIPLMRFLII